MASRTGLRIVPRGGRGPGGAKHRQSVKCAPSHDRFYRRYHIFMEPAVEIFVCPPDGKKITTDRDAVDLVGEAYQHGASVVLIPAERLDADFFRLETRIAGEILQKFVNYKLRVAIVGDISQHVAKSSALRDFVYESNRGHHVWFVSNRQELNRKLEHN